MAPESGKIGKGEGTSVGESGHTVRPPPPNHSLLFSLRGTMG